mmetsp:Transcript_24836/g.47191  ORF Transcript_24836/g.47191 Transcript_24836/m.47191 type:complete len:242 (-) Transcript_24836:149-874(-)
MIQYTLPMHTMDLHHAPSNQFTITGTALVQITFLHAIVFFVRQQAQFSIDFVKERRTGICFGKTDVARGVCGIHVAHQTHGHLLGQIRHGHGGHVKDASLASHGILVETEIALVILIDVKDQKEGQETTNNGNILCSSYFCHKGGGVQTGLDTNAGVDSQHDPQQGIKQENLQTRSIPVTQRFPKAVLGTCQNTPANLFQLLQLLPSIIVSRRLVEWTDRLGHRHDLVTETATHGRIGLVG